MSDQPRESASDVPRSPRPSQVQQRKSMMALAMGSRSDHRPRRSVGWRNRDIIRTTAMILGVWFAAQLFWIAHQLFFVVFLGMLFGIAVSGGTSWLQRYRIPRGIGASLIVLTVVGSLIGFGAWVAPTLRDQGTELKQKLPEAVDRVQDWVDAHRGGILGMVLPAGQPAPAATNATPGKQATSASPAPGQSASAPPVAAKPIAGAAQTQATSGSVRMGDQLREHMGGFRQYLFPFITSTIEVLGGVLLILFLSIYFAAEPELYRNGLLSMLPSKKRARGRVMMDRVAVVLRKWLVTQLIAMVAICVVSTIVLLIFHVKAAFALGVLAGLFEFIPTIGPILSAMPAVAMAFLDSPEKAASVALAYWAVQFFENHLLIPLLMKQGIKLPPALTVITQTLLAIIFGFMGLMVAVPLLATVIVFIQMFYLEQMPVEGTWTYPAYNGDLDEPLEAGGLPGR